VTTNQSHVPSASWLGTKKVIRYLPTSDATKVRLFDPPRGRPPVGSGIDAPEQAIGGAIAETSRSSTIAQEWHSVVELLSQETSTVQPSGTLICMARLP